MRKSCKKENNIYICVYRTEREGNKVRYPRNTENERQYTSRGYRQEASWSQAMLHELQRDGAAQQRPRGRCGSESIKQPPTRPGGATHALRDGDEADADERQGAAGVAAGPGEGRPSDPSRGSEARHAHAWPHARAPAHNRTLSACCARGRRNARAHTREQHMRS